MHAGAGMCLESKQHFANMWDGLGIRRNQASEKAVRLQDNCKPWVDHNCMKGLATMNQCMTMSGNVLAWSLSCSNKHGGVIWLCLHNGCAYTTKQVYTKLMNIYIYIYIYVCICIYV